MRTSSTRCAGFFLLLLLPDLRWWSPAALANASSDDDDDDYHGHYYQPRWRQMYGSSGWWVLCYGFDADLIDQEATRLAQAPSAVHAWFSCENTSRWGG